MQPLPDLDDEPVVALEMFVDERGEEVGCVEGRVVFVVQVEEVVTLSCLDNLFKILFVTNLISEKKCFWISFKLAYMRIAYHIEIKNLVECLRILVLLLRYKVTK